MLANSHKQLIEPVETEFQVEMLKSRQLIQMAKDGTVNVQTHLMNMEEMWRMLTHFNLRKCKLNARNAIDNMMPIRASVDTTKNATGDMVATRNLKTRFAIGT